MADVTILNTSANLTAKTLEAAENDNTITGLKTFSRSPLAPFAVTAASAKVTNLEADKLDGEEGSAFHDASLLTGTVAAGVTWGGATVAVTKGGTGVATLTNHGVVLGQGASAVAATGAGSAGQVLTSNGAAADPTFQAPAASSTVYSVANGRLTLESGVAVSTTDQTAKTTLYFTPIGGNQIGLYDGVSAWTVLTFAELSLSLVGYTASKPYDIWVYNNSGTAALESTVWTNTTTRATALALQDGIYVKSGTTTRRYLGTIYINASGGQTDDTLTKASVWNYYNRKLRPLLKISTSSGWIYSTNTWQQAQGSTAYQFDCVVGVAEDMIKVDVMAMVFSDASGGQASVGVGVDSTTTTSAQAAGIFTTFNNSNYIPLSAHYNDRAQVGRHTYVWTEIANVGGGGAAYTWVGALTPPSATGGYQASMRGELLR